MLASRRLLALVGTTLALVTGAVAAAPAIAAGNPIIQECQSSGQLTHAYTVKQLRHALAVMPATVKQYTSCYDVVQNALVSAGKHGGTAPASGGKSGGSSFLSTPVIIILVLVILAAVTFGALAIRRRRADPGEAQDFSGPAAPAEGTRTEVMPSVPPPGGADDTAETRAMPSVPPAEGSDEEALTRVDEPEGDRPEHERP